MNNHLTIIKPLTPLQKHKLNEATTFVGSVVLACLGDSARSDDRRNFEADLCTTGKSSSIAHPVYSSGSFISGLLKNSSFLLVKLDDMHKFCWFNTM